MRVLAATLGLAVPMVTATTPEKDGYVSAFVSARCLSLVLLSCARERDLTVVTVGFAADLV